MGASRAPFFDAVVFDLDGTLVATDRFWVQAARTGARRAFAALGLTRELPSAEQWMGLVGKAMEQGMRDLFPDLDEAARRVVQEACEEEEHALLAAGGAALMPGAREALEALRRAGVRLGIASNCSWSYLSHMLEALGLGELVEEARCLDSAGIGSKSDMIAEILACFRTRSAVMVGDRAGDRDAAWANGLPHVHCAFGFAAREERIDAEATIEDLGGLRALLARRAAWVEHALERVGAFRGARRGAPVLGVTGGPCAGKSLFARDAVRLLEERGVGAALVSLDWFPGDASADGDDPTGGLLDVDALLEEVLEPHAAGRPVELRPPGRAPLVVEPERTLVVEGPFLFDPRLHRRLERVIHLAIPEALALRRAAAPLAGPGLAAVRAALPRQAAFEERYPAARLADLVLDASNPLGTIDGPGGSASLADSAVTW